MKARLATYTVEGAHLDPDAVVGEAIADRGGLKAAYHAYIARHPQATALDGLTGEQRFFLGFAQMYARRSRPEWLLESMKDDTHTPSALRVTDTVSGLDEFDRAFGCDHHRDCEVW